MEIKSLILILMIPIISAFIGWLTNFIAIKSLFRPVEKINILGVKFQGLIPKRKRDLAVNISEVVEEYFLSHEDIKESLEKPSNINKIKRKILPILESKILEKIPLMFQVIAKPIIKKTLESEIDSVILKINDEIINHAFEVIDIKKIIVDKIKDYDIDELERITYKIAKKELKHIEYLGAIIGFILGLTQVFIAILL
ncbi:MAG: DUF445 domain-containing protein [Nanoarchaeota archaeon]